MPWPAMKTETDAATSSSFVCKSDCRLSSAGKKIDPVRVAPMAVNAIVLRQHRSLVSSPCLYGGRRMTTHASTIDFR
jgi:hypothetical protein